MEKFFDNVPQDKLMSYVGRIIYDIDTESLIRKYLKSGVMEHGLKGKMVQIVKIVKIVQIDEHLRTMLRKVIWKQWKTPRKQPWGLRKLGICNDLAKLTSYSGDRYEWGVRRTCVVRAISKEVLVRRVLVSCLDYYAIRHSLKTN